MINYDSSSTESDTIPSTDSKSKVTVPTIGEAVKEAIETGEEVVLQGKTDVGYTPPDTNELPNKSNDTNVLLESNDLVLSSADNSTDSSKIEVTTATPSNEVPVVDERIIIDHYEERNKEEAKIASVTSIAADEEGLEVEVQTEIEVPIEESEKKVESQSKVIVDTGEASKELPLD